MIITSPTKLAKIFATIKEKNEEFKKSTKPQQRVLVAQDVLAQIKAKRYVAEQGAWTTPTYAEPVLNSGPEESVQKLFANQTIRQCNVCALGGLFMSCTNLNNNTTVEELDRADENLGDELEYRGNLSNGLDKIFTNKQLELIEIYFENGDGYYGSLTENPETDHVSLFNNKYTNPQDRLKEIMKNIIENNGTFTPKKLKVSKDLTY